MMLSNVKHHLLMRLLWPCTPYAGSLSTESVPQTVDRHAEDWAHAHCILPAWAHYMPPLAAQLPTMTPVAKQPPQPSKHQLQQEHRRRVLPNN
jgi:hypothetical protein